MINNNWKPLKGTELKYQDFEAGSRSRMLIIAAPEYDQDDLFEKVSNASIVFLGDVKPTLRHLLASMGRPPFVALFGKPMGSSTYIKLKKFLNG